MIKNKITPILIGINETINIPINHPMNGNIHNKINRPKKIQNNVFPINLNILVFILVDMIGFEPTSLTSIRQPAYPKAPYPLIRL